MKEVISKLKKNNKYGFTLIGRKVKSRAFTLIESLAVIAIIGILVSLSIYTISQAQRQARDATRKSDVSAIAQGFEARALDRTCTNQADVGLYPGKVILDDNPGEPMRWQSVEILYDNPEDLLCNLFSSYLPTRPEDPQGVNYYLFNLSAASGKEGKHYRIAALLERDLSDSQERELCRQSKVWVEEFNGTRYGSCGSTSRGGGELVGKYSLFTQTALARFHGGGGLECQEVGVPEEECPDDDPPPPPPPPPTTGGNGDPAPFSQYNYYIGR